MTLPEDPHVTAETVLEGSSMEVIADGDREEVEALLSDLSVQHQLQQVSGFTYLLLSNFVTFHASHG